MYISLEEAKEEIWTRWTNLSLRRRVEDYWGELPPWFRVEPRAVIARHVGSPNIECGYFVERSKEAQLKPLCFEYPNDKFYTVNPDKLMLGKIVFSSSPRGRRKTKIIDLSASDGKPFVNINTLWGEGFVDFHHRLLSLKYPEIETANNAGWLNQKDGVLAMYVRLFSLFLCHGVLFENFHEEGHESRFTSTIVKPAIKGVEECFGLSPLIVPIVSIEDERNPRLSWYPDDLESEVLERLSLPKASENQCRVLNG